MVEEWLGHPITKQLVNIIEKEKKELMHMLVTGCAERSTSEGTAVEYTKLVSRIEGLKVFETFYYAIGGE